MLLQENRQKKLKSLTEKFFFKTPFQIVFTIGQTHRDNEIINTPGVAGHMPQAVRAGEPFRCGWFDSTRRLPKHCKGVFTFLELATCQLAPPSDTSGGGIYAAVV